MIPLAVLLLAGQAATSPLTDAQMEDFLLHARIVRSHSISKGITAPVKATLTDGVLTHDAEIQTVDERRSRFESATGVEFNFRDSWMYNVAAYRLDRLIGLNLVPVSVTRRHEVGKAAFTWWVDEVMMEEGDRLKRKATAPDVERWNQQMQLVRLFDQLIANTDRNVGNLLITRDWRIWAIDHTRAFRLNRTLKVPANITRCDRQAFEKLKQLDRQTLKRHVGDVLNDAEIEALLARRDAVVARVESLGPAALFDRAQP